MEHAVEPERERAGQRQIKAGKCEKACRPDGARAGAPDTAVQPRPSTSVGGERAERGDERDRNGDVDRLEESDTVGVRRGEAGGRDRQDRDQAQQCREEGRKPTA